MKLSLVIPVFNEEAVLPLTLARLRTVLSGMDCDYEIVFVNDGSRDGSLEILTREAAADSRIKAVSFARNFGHQAAVTAGLDFAGGDAVVVMDADLQDPPELLPKMVALYRQGYDVVSPQRVSREGETWFKRQTASMFYRLMRSLADADMPAQVGDFRLLSHDAVRAIRQFREQHRFMRGMIAWLGLREALLPFERQARAAGETKYPLWKMLRFSWTAITSFSAVPLRMTMTVGFLTVAFAFAYLFYAIFEAFVAKHVTWGWTSLVFLQCFFSGLTLICVGLMGDYVARIYEEAKGRPLYVANRILNLSEPQDVSRITVIQSGSAVEDTISLHAGDHQR
jgi:glycosyltransferase involved in cell wall biosynthesis